MHLEEPGEADSNQIISIILIDDDLALSGVVCRLLEREEDVKILGNFSSAEQALHANLWNDATVAIVDLDLPGISGIELIQKVHNYKPDMICLAYTIHTNREAVYAALRAGAVGYLVKGCSGTDLKQSLRQVVAGESPMSPSIARYLLTYFVQNPPEAEEGATLSHREQAIVQCLSEGLIYKEVAEKLVISPHTVHTHIKKIYQKLHATDRQQALKRAKLMGYLKK